MNKQFEQVKEFHTACGVEMTNKPTKLDRGELSGHWAHQFGVRLINISDQMKSHDRGGEVQQRSSWILEELSEFLFAETLEDQADALIDLIYFALGTFTLMGIKPERIFDIVQAANMAKVGPDGKVTRNTQGKIQKPEGWKPPEEAIREEIERQRKE